MENATSTPLIVLKELAGNQPTSLNTLQKFLLPHMETLTMIWFLIWCATVIIVLVHLVREYRRRGH